MYRLFLCLRYLRKRRIAFFAVGAVCLCVAMVLIVFSVMDGFLRMVRERSRGMLSDLVIEGHAYQGFPFYEEFMAAMMDDPAIGPRIHQATPVIITYGIVRFPDRQTTKPVQIVGMRLQETYEVNDFREGLFYERYYPGTTTLGRISEPRYGIDATGKLILPERYEAAHGMWREQAAPGEIRSAWRHRYYVLEMHPGTIPRALDSKDIPRELKDRLAQHGIDIPVTAFVDIVRKATAWRIHFDDENSILIRLEPSEFDDRREDLVVLKGEYPGPGFYRSITWQGRNERGNNDPVELGPAHPGIILGTDMIAWRRRTGEYDRFCYRGQVVQLTMVPMTASGKIDDATGMPTDLFRYIDDCRTGVFDIDKMSAYVDFDYLQPILEWHEQRTEMILDNGESRDIVLPARTTQLQVKLRPESNVIETRDLIQKKWSAFYPNYLDRVSSPYLLSEVRVVTWEEKQRDFIAAVEKEKVLVLVLFGIVSIVAVLLVGCIFYMIVQQKTRDIGIIKSVGASAIGVARIFIGYGAAVGVTGGALGLLVGVLFVNYINEIQDLLVQIHPDALVWNPEIYTFDRIPDHVDAGPALVIYVVAIFASMLGSVVAAVRAARVWPVEALRYE